LLKMILTSILKRDIINSKLYYMNKSTLTL
jgi:hypothetical protein